MGQQEVQNVLEKKKCWVRSTEIIKIIKIVSPKSVNRALRKMCENGEVERRRKSGMEFEYKII